MKSFSRIEISCLPFSHWMYLPVSLLLNHEWWFHPSLVSSTFLSSSCYSWSTFPDSLDACIFYQLWLGKINICLLVITLNSGITSTILSYFNVYVSRWCSVVFLFRFHRVKIPLSANEFIIHLILCFCEVEIHWTSIKNSDNVGIIVDYTRE